MMSFEWRCACGFETREASLKARNASIKKHLAGQNWELHWDSNSNYCWITTQGRQSFLITDGACHLVRDVFGVTEIGPDDTCLSNGIINVGKQKKDYIADITGKTKSYSSRCFCCGEKYRRIVSARDNRWIKTASNFSVSFCNKCDKFAGYLRNNNALSCRSRGAAAMLLSNHPGKCIKNDNRITVLSGPRACGEYKRAIKKLDRFTSSSKTRQISNRLILHYMLWMVGNFVSHIETVDSDIISKDFKLDWKFNYRVST